MCLIEIRNLDGVRLAASDDLSGAIQQLVYKIDSYQRIVRQHHRAMEAAAALTEADVSACDPKHIVGFRAGWRACLEAVVATLHENGQPVPRPAGNDAP